MAKKSTGRLAGLAALAAAAYMANKGESKSKGADRDTDTGVDATPKKADDIMVSGEGGFDTPADMSSSPRVGTPAPTVSSPSSPAAKAPVTGGPTPSRDPGGVGKRGGVSVGTGSGGGRGAAAGEEAAYRASRDTGDAMSRRMSAIPADTSDAVSRRKNVEETATASPVDETKLSLSERLKLSRERARSGSGQTDTRSVNERFAGMKKGGKVKKMASGGMASSASKRGDGIASKGKTRCKMY